MYGWGCCAIDGMIKLQMSVAGNRMLSPMSGVITVDKIKISVMWGSIGKALIGKKSTE